jgi:hypothetical protein
MGQLDKDWNFSEFGIFGGRVQRRGGRVSTPEIGSRGAEICFGGILRFHADLRREFYWGNLVWVFFWVVGGVPRRDVEEGGHLCAFSVQLGEFICVN